MVLENISKASARVTKTSFHTSFEIVLVLEKRMNADVTYDSDFQPTAEAIFMKAVFSPRAAVADPALIMNRLQSLLRTHCFDSIQRVSVDEPPLREFRVRCVVGIHGNQHIAKVTFRDVLQDVHVVCQAHAGRVSQLRGLGADHVVPAAPSVAKYWHLR